MRTSVEKFINNFYRRVYGNSTSVLFSFFRKALLGALVLVAFGVVGYFLFPTLCASCGVITEDGAIERVQARSEVQSFAETLRAAGKEPQFIAQDEDDHWIVQVLEVVNNGNEAGHTATFGWYRVEKKGGEVTNEL